MKKMMIIAAVAAISAPAFADEIAPTATVPTAPVAGQMPGGPGMGGEHHGGFMMNLTDAQKTCLETAKANCPQFDMKAKMAGMQPGEKPQLSDEDKAAMQASHDCMKKAMTDCGIQMPAKPEMKDGQKPGEGKGFFGKFFGGKGKGDGNAPTQPVAPAQPAAPVVQ